MKRGSEPNKKFLAKRIRAHDGCLGIMRRRRTRQTAISHGEPSTGFDPWISEWGNPPVYPVSADEFNSPPRRHWGK